MANKNEARLGMNISDYEKKLAKATDELNKFVRGGVGNLGNLSNAFGALQGRSGGSMSMLVGSLGRLAATFGVTASAATVARSSIETAMNFEKSMSGLKALTGLGSDAMEELKDAAIDMGSRTTQTASQVADAFKLIGSAKPELLGNVAALKSVTQEAITLAEASGMEVPEAAKALTTSLNQMGAGADQASRYVNVLAAGSQKGAGDITWLNAAITQSGTAAKAVGAEYEELVANLEQLAQGGFEAGSAGTALRSIIMSLEKQSNEALKPSVVGLTTAFRNLGKECRSISDYQKLTGKEFASQAMILSKNAEKAEEMRTAITGTATATEQAKVNNDNFAGSVKNLSSAWEGLMLTINSSNGMLRGWVDNTTTLINNLKYLMSSHDKQVQMGADKLLNMSGIQKRLASRMDATVANNWSKEDATRMALKELDQWFYVQRAQHRNNEKELEMVMAAYEKAQAYVRGYFAETEKAAQATADLATAADGITTDGDGKKKKTKIVIEGSIEELQEQLKKAKEAVQNAASATAQAEAQVIVNAIEKAIKQREFEVQVKVGAIEGSLTNALKKATVNTHIDQTSGLAAAAKNVNLKEAPNAFVKQQEANLEKMREQKDLMDEIKAFNTENAMESVYQLSDAFQTLGNSIGGTAGTLISFVGQMAQQIVQGVSTIANLKAQAAAYDEEAAAVGLSSSAQTSAAAAKGVNASASSALAAAALSGAAGLNAEAAATGASAAAQATGTAAKGNNAAASKALAAAAASSTAGLNAEAAAAGADASMHATGAAAKGSNAAASSALAQAAASSAAGLNAEAAAAGADASMHATGAAVKSTNAAASSALAAAAAASAAGLNSEAAAAGSDASVQATGAAAKVSNASASAALAAAAASSAAGLNAEAVAAGADASMHATGAAAKNTNAAASSALAMAAAASAAGLEVEASAAGTDATMHASGAAAKSSNAAASAALAAAAMAGAAGLNAEAVATGADAAAQASGAASKSVNTTASAVLATAAAASAAGLNAEASAAGMNASMQTTDAAAKSANTASSAVLASSTVVATAGLAAEAAAANTDATAQVADASAKALNAHAFIPFVGVAMGLGMVASIVAAMKSLPQFAEGAYADRPTLGIFGEKGPEIVTPERKLDEAFERNAGKMGMGGKVEFKIKDSELVGILESYESRKNRRV